MRIFTDCPERFAAQRVVDDPGRAEVIILFRPQSAGLAVGTGKPLYLVANRMPLSLAESGASMQVVRPADLDRLLGEGAKPQVPPVPDMRRGTTATIEGPVTIPEVVVSYSPGTNVGKTFIASNMAAWLALKGRPTVLLDLDMEASATWEMLGWRSFRPPSMTAWNGDTEAVRQAVAAGAHPVIDKMYLVKRGVETSAGQVVRAIRILAGLGFSVVVDTANNQELPYIDAVLRLAEKVFLVATLTLKVQARLAEMYATARSAGAPAGRMVLCVNRVGSPEEERNLRPADLARQFMLGRPYVVHEDARGRRMALKKKTLPVAVKSAVSRELAGMFENELTARREDKAGRNKAGFWALRKVVM